MTRRYFATHLPVQGGLVSLDESETHHAINVMRIRSGETVCLFDGMGREASAIVETVGRREVSCQASPAQSVDRENEISLIVGVAMPKGDRSKELVERLTELGVNVLVPLHCKRTQWPVPDNAITKWQRVVIDACKQSGRNHLMQIESPQSADQWFKQNAAPDCAKLIAHPDAQPDPHFSSATTVLPGPQEKYRSARIAIGPEGGFSEEEIEVADQQGWQRMSLGNRIYRIETATILSVIRVAGL